MSTIVSARRLVSPTRMFLKKLFLFLLPFLCWMMIEFAILPIHFFAFRVWESLEVMEPGVVLQGPFYPNQHVRMIESGMITRYTSFARKRPVEWHTDRYGYRNRDTSALADIVLIGDSFMVGTLLTQNETLSEVLTRQTGYYTYCLSPSFHGNDHVDHFLANQRFRAFPPKVVVLGKIECWLPELTFINPEWVAEQTDRETALLARIREKSLIHQSAVFLDRLTKLSVVHYSSAWLKRKIKGEKTLLKEAYIYHDEAFLHGPKANTPISDQKIAYLAKVIRSYHDSLARHNIRFIFMPIPNKENVYANWLPASAKPVFLTRLIQQVQQQGVEVVDLQPAYDSLHRHQNLPIYHHDDDHWNALGVQIAAQKIAAHLRTPALPTQ